MLPIQSEEKLDVYLCPVVIGLVSELFRKIEPYLTFLNIHQLERQGADIQSKVQELEDLNSSLRERDKVKDDAIAHLSDQLLAISTRLQELELKQQTTMLTS